MSEQSFKCNSKRIQFLFPSFPDPVKKAIKYDREGLYSATDLKTAVHMTNILSDLCWRHFREPACTMSVMDCTAGIGGNTFALGRHFREVVAVEIHRNRCHMLRHNVGAAGLEHKVRCIHDNVVNVVRDLKEALPSILYIDPPWGGQNYRKEPLVHLQLSYKPLHVFIHSLPPKTLLAIKLPLNADLPQLTDSLHPGIRVEYLHKYRQMQMLVLLT